MFTTMRMAAVLTAALFLACPDFPDRQTSILLLGDAHAIVGAPWTPLSYAGVARRTTRRTVELTSAATAPAPVVVAAPVATPAPAPPPVSSSPIPVGTVVRELPGQCSQIVANNVSYSVCGGVYYKAALQGNDLVYVVVDRP